MLQTSTVADLVAEIKTYNMDFKRMLLMYLVTSVFAPTTSTLASNRIFPILVCIF